MLRRTLVRLSEAPPVVGANVISNTAANEIAQHGHEMQKGVVTTKMDETALNQAGLVSGAPPELTARQVRIFRPGPSTMQSGKAGYNFWKLDFDVLGSGGRWINPLMGWASSADYQQALSLKFSSQQSAVDFCTRQGWDYQVSKPNVQPFVPKAYAENFIHQPDKLRLLRTK